MLGSRVPARARVRAVEQMATAVEVAVNVGKAMEAEVGMGRAATRAARQEAAQDGVADDADRYRQQGAER